MTTQAMFTLDLNRCTGCSACAVACTIENDVSEGLAWREIHTINASRHPDAATYHLSLACNHCVDPACMHGCPAAAYTKDAVTGAVLLNQDHCIGCGYCAWVCPFDAPQLNTETGVMEKCTFCSPRLAEGLEPACVHACPVDALGFKAQGQPTPQNIPGFPNTELLPAIDFTPKRSGAAPSTGDSPARAVAKPRAPRLIAARLRSEWPLLVFSLIVTGMVAWQASAVLSGSGVNGALFALLGLAAMAVSTLHLGRPSRAWRAILNVRTSWVSREILFFSAFWGAASATALLPLLEPARWVAAALGLAALYCVDRVYLVPGQRFNAVPHSAMTSLTAVYLIALALTAPWLAGLCAAVKLALYPWRDAMRGEIPYAMTALRVGLGVVWPLVIWIAIPTPEPLLLLAGPAIGEITDRVRFYSELDFMTPTRSVQEGAGVGRWT